MSVVLDVCLSKGGLHEKGVRSTHSHTVVFSLRWIQKAKLSRLSLSFLVLSTMSSGDFHQLGRRNETVQQKGRGSGSPRSTGVVSGERRSRQTDENKSIETCRCGDNRRRGRRLPPFFPSPPNLAICLMYSSGTFIYKLMVGV